MANISYAASTLQSSTLIPDNAATAIIAIRVPWSAVFAGVAVALVTQLLLSLLGTGIGISTIDPLQYNGTPTASTLSLSAALWWVVSSFISLGAGGWITAHFSSPAGKIGGAIYGLITWSIVTLITIYMVGSVIGSVISGSVSAIGTAATVAGRGVAGLAPNIAAEVVDSPLIQSHAPWDNIKREAQILLAQTGKPGLQPKVISQKIDNAVNGETSDALLDSETSSVIERLLSEGKNAAHQVDREALINIIIARTGTSRAEAARRVQYWEDSYQQAEQKFERTKKEAQQTAREAADKTARALSRTALWGFLALALSALAAVIGGIAGVTDYWLIYPKKPSDQATAAQ